MDVSNFKTWLANCQIPNGPVGLLICDLDEDRDILPEITSCNQLLSWLKRNGFDQEAVRAAPEVWRLYVNGPQQK